MGNLDVWYSRIGEAESGNAAGQTDRDYEALVNAGKEKLIRVATTA